MDDDFAAESAARAAGLKRLRRMTWHATQIGTIAAVGFAVVFARTAAAPVLTGHETAVRPAVTASIPP